MEIKVLEEKKNKLVVSIKGETHTLCNALVKELWNDKHVKAAGYKIDHPLVGIPNLMVETDGADPRKTINSAADRLVKSADEFKKAAKSVKE
jgi:DNA-directed RNA polymerase subunit L